MNTKTNKTNSVITLIKLLITIIIIIILIGITLNLTNSNQQNSNQSLQKIPTTNQKIKNVIFMIGDGMGENHIMAGEIYKGEKLNIQKIPNKSYVKTASLSPVTDSAAAATALATGYKTNNYTIGKDKDGNDVENLTEYCVSKGLKTGIVCTQKICHATPAGFTVHSNYRYDYSNIALSQINSNIDLMLGGGRIYFQKFEKEMLANNYKWINDFSEIESIGKNEKIIGTFAEKSICREEPRTYLKSMTKEALDRLDNENGFFVMIEGSDIDTYSHEQNMSQMLEELMDFDDAVSISMEYVDNNPDTLLIVTADHETGGLNLQDVTSASLLTNALFTKGDHTDADVLVYAYGVGAKDFTKYDVIDNTSICKFVRNGLENYYGK